MASPQLIKPTNTPQSEKRPAASGLISAGQRVAKLPEISYGRRS